MLSGDEKVAPLECMALCKETDADIDIDTEVDTGSSSAASVASGAAPSLCRSVMVGINDSPRDGECHLLFQGPDSIRAVDNLVIYTRETEHPFPVVETVWPTPPPSSALPAVALKNCSRYSTRVECIFLNFSSVPAPFEPSEPRPQGDEAAVVAEELSLRGNPLQQLVASSFKSPGWKMLQVLDVSHCLLTTIAPATFATLGQLRVLRLSENIDLAPALWAVGGGGSSTRQGGTPAATLRSHQSPFCSSALDASNTSASAVTAATLHCAAANTMSLLDLSQTNLANVPSYFFDHVGLHTLSSFVALGLEQFAAVERDAFSLRSGKVCDISVGISQATSPAAASAAASSAAAGSEESQQRSVSQPRTVSWCETKRPSTPFAKIECTCAATDGSGNPQFGYGPGTWTTTTPADGEQQEDAVQNHHGCWQFTKVPDSPTFRSQVLAPPPPPPPPPPTPPPPSAEADGDGDADAEGRRARARKATGSEVACKSRLTYAASISSDSGATVVYAKAIITAPNAGEITYAMKVLCIAPATVRSMWKENDDRSLALTLEADIVNLESAAAVYPECTAQEEYTFDFDAALQSTVQVFLVANNEARDAKESSISAAVTADTLELEPCGMGVLSSTADDAAGDGLAAGPAVGIALGAVLVIVLVAAAVRRVHDRRLLNKPVDRAAFMELAQSMQESGMFIAVADTYSGGDGAGMTAVTAAATAAAAPGGAGFRGEEEEEGIRYPRELSRSCVDLIEQIGQGNFGYVMKGLLDERKASGSGSGSNMVGTTPSFAVAVKMTKIPEDGSSSDEEMVAEFVREAVITAQFVHPNVVGLVGVVSAGRPLLMVMELCEHGSLSAFLKKRRAERWHVSLGQRLSICEQTAVGLGYMASKRFVHRDVAARNILVSADFRFKISDFGLGREVSEDAEGAYYRANRGLAMPVRWCSPEVLNEGLYSTASDVWAWAVMAREVFTDAELPYKGMKNAEVWSKVSGGQFQPEAPVTCPPAIWNGVVAPCFSPTAAARPSFMRLAQLVADHNPDSAARISNELRQQQQVGTTDADAASTSSSTLDSRGTLADASTVYWQAGDPLHADAVQYLVPTATLGRSASGLALAEGRPSPSDTSAGSVLSHYEYVVGEGVSGAANVVQNAAFSPQHIPSGAPAAAVAATPSYVNGNVEVHGGGGSSSSSVAPSALLSRNTSVYAGFDGGGNSDNVYETALTANTGGSSEGALGRKASVYGGFGGGGGDAAGTAAPYANGMLVNLDSVGVNTDDAGSSSGGGIATYVNGEVQQQQQQPPVSAWSGASSMNISDAVVINGRGKSGRSYSVPLSSEL